MYVCTAVAANQSAVKTNKLKPEKIDGTRLPLAVAKSYYTIGQKANDRERLANLKFLFLFLLFECAVCACECINSFGNS